jgi:membrane protease YdiL (CAAX protease family)
MKQINIRKHSLLESLLYHLLPGILIGAGYYLIVPRIQAEGYPSVVAIILTAIFILIPVELGILFWHGKRRNGKLSLMGIVLYRQKLDWHQYLLWIVVIFISSGLIITVLNPVSTIIEGWFTWIPENLRLGMGLSDAFTKSKLIQTYALHFVFIVIIAPAIEELYFRGFLLPRMPKNLGWAAPIVHSLLFAVYHVWSPWMFLARTLALLPLIYIVRWKKNIFLGVGAHWLVNSIDLVMGVMFILSMG